MEIKRASKLLLLVWVGLEQRDGRHRRGAEPQQEHADVSLREKGHVGILS